MSEKENKKKAVIQKKAVIIKKSGRSSTIKHRDARNDSSPFGRKRDQDTVDEYLPKPKIKKGGKEEK